MRRTACGPPSPSSSSGSASSQPTTWSPGRTRSSRTPPSPDSLQRAGEPFVVVVDDLQWVDAATLGVLELLAGEVAALPMVLAVTVRAPWTCGPPRWPASPSSAGRTAQRIDLGGLGVADVETWLGRPGPTGQAVGRLVHDRTGGHPFFVRELVALLADRRRRASTSGRAGRRAGRRPRRRAPSRLAAAGADPAVDDGRRGPRTAGRPRRARRRRRRADRRRAGGLEPALAAGLLEPDPDRVGQLLFAHALVADALRAEQTAAGLARRHAVVTGVIERRWAGDLDAVIDELAIHAHAGAAAGTAAAAVGHGARAAELATAANAPADAAAHLRRALDALAVAAPGDRVRRQQLSTDLGIALAAGGDAMGGGPRWSKPLRWPTRSATSTASCGPCATSTATTCGPASTGRSTTPRRRP